MKRLSVLLLTAILFAFGGTCLWAFDYGGSLSTATEASSAPGGGVLNEEALGLWLETGRGGHYSFEMKLDIIASFSNEDIGFYIYPDYLKLDGLWNDLEYGPSILTTSLGRFTASDFSANVFSQKLDGLIMNFSYPAVDLTIAAGTTGLRFANTGELLTTSPAAIISKTDARLNASGVGLFDYLFTPAPGETLLDNPKAVEILTLSLPRIVYGQSLTLSVVAQEDLRPMIDVINGYFDDPDDTSDDYTSPLLQEGETTYYPDRGGAVDTQYFGLGVSGPSIAGLYHNVFYYFGTGRTLSYKADTESPTGSSYQYDMILSHLFGASVDYFMPQFLNSRANIGLTLGTGDPDDPDNPNDDTDFYEGNNYGYYTQFTPVTGGGGGLLFSPGVSNILTANIGFSVKPLERLSVPFISSMQAAASFIPFFRLTDGPVSVSGISSGFDGNYLGSEIDLTVNMRPYSDFGIIFQTGFFLPNKTAFAGSPMADPSFMARLNASLSF